MPIIDLIVKCLIEQIILLSERERGGINFGKKENQCAEDGVQLNSFVRLSHTGATIQREKKLENSDVCVCVCVSEYKQPNVLNVALSIDEE